MLHVNESSTLEAGERITFVSKHNGFDARLSPEGSEIWLAVANQITVSEGEVVLFKLDLGGAKLLSRCQMRKPWMPLFCGDSLLVYARTDGSGGCDWEVHQLNFAAGRFDGERRVILTGGDPSNVRNVFTPEWCVANSDQQLVAWNLEPDEFTIFTIYKSLL